jgi:hypothetical protein
LNHGENGVRAGKKKVSTPGVDAAVYLHFHRQAQTVTRTSSGLEPAILVLVAFSVFSVFSVVQSLLL